MTTRHAAPSALQRVGGLLRVFHPFPTAVVVLVSGLLLAALDFGLSDLSGLLRGMAVILMSQIAVGALNDYMDRDRDALVQPEKPIPSGLVPPWGAGALVAVTLAALVPLALSFGTTSLVLALAGTAGGIVYDVWLKPTAAGVLGYMVGFLALVTWVFAVGDRLSGWILPLYPFGGLALLAAHLANCFPDIEADASVGEHNLAVLLGPERTFLVICVSFAVVACCGLGAALLTRQWTSLCFIIPGTLIGGGGSLIYSSAPHDISARRHLFRALAPAIGLVAVGCLLVVKSLSA